MNVQISENSFGIGILQERFSKLMNERLKFQPENEQMN